MKSITTYVLSLTIVIALSTSCSRKSPAITRNNIKPAPLLTEQCVGSNESGYRIVPGIRKHPHATYTESVLQVTTAPGKPHASEKLVRERVSSKPIGDIPFIPIVHAGRSYQQTASDKIYEDDTVQRRKVYGIEQITTDKTSILSEDKGLWYAVQTNENSVTASLYKKRSTRFPGATKSRSIVPGDKLPVVELEIVQAGLNVVNSENGLAIATLHLVEINQQGDSSCLDKDKPLPGELQHASPFNAAMMSSGTSPNALISGELVIEVVRADIWDLHQQHGLPRKEAPDYNATPGDAELRNNLSEAEMRQAYEALRTILKAYDLPEIKAAWQKICADMERRKVHYIVNISGRVSTPLK